MGRRVIVRISGAFPGTMRCFRVFPLWKERFGALAQLGEHLLCKQGVIGSIPIRSTNDILPCGADVDGARDWRCQSFAAGITTDLIIKRRCCV